MLSIQSMITMKSTSQYLSGFMASITIRNLDDKIKSRLRIAAARHGCSMEEEVRRILRHTFITEDSPGQLGTRISNRFKNLGGVELPEPVRSASRDAPVFSETDE